MSTSDGFATYCAPTYFIDTAITENAGDGMVRIWNCSTKGGVLVPQCEIIIRATRLIVAARLTASAAQDIFNSEMMRGGLH